MTEEKKTRTPKKVTVWYPLEGTEDAMIVAEQQPPTGMTDRAKLEPWARTNIPAGQDFVIITSILKGRNRKVERTVLELT